MEKMSVTSIFYFSTNIFDLTNPFPSRQILASSKLVYDNFKFDENGRNLSIRVENTAGKQEITHNEQFLLSPQCFQNM